MKSLIKTILVFAFALAPLAVSAAPGIPHQFYGTVKFDNGGVTAPDGITVEVKTVSGLVVGSSSTSGGRYGYNPSLLFVNDLNDGSAGDVSVGQILHFFVNGIDAGATATFANGELTEKNLTLAGTIGTIAKTENDVIANQNVVVTPQNSTSITMGTKLSIGISSTANSEALVEKVEQLGSDTVVAISGKNLLNAYDIKISGENLSISVTMSYDDSGIDENTIAPHRYHNNVWSEISPYSINKVNNTLTFTITAGQTVYAVFGTTESEPVTTPDTNSGGNNGGGGGGGGGYVPVQNNTPTPTATPTTTPDTGTIEPEGRVLGGTVGVYPNGTLLKAPDSAAVWYISGDQKHLIRSGAVFETRFNWDDVITLPSTRQLDLYEQGSDVAFASGVLVKEASSPAVYRVSSDGRVAPIVSGEIFLARGYSFANVIEVGDGFLTSYPTVAAIDSKDAFYNGDLVKIAGSPAVYYIDDNTARVIPSADVFFEHAFQFKNVRTVNAELFGKFARGANMTYPDGTLVKGDGPAVYVISNGMKRPIYSGADFEALLYQWDKIRDIPESLLVDIPLASPVRLVSLDVHLVSN